MKPTRDEARPAIPSAAQAVGSPPPDGLCGEPRPLTYWLACHPPGWVSRHPAPSADPIALAIEIHALAQSYGEWRRLARDERWDTFVLQTFSAALFNRYPRENAVGRPSLTLGTVALQELNWPGGSEGICACLTAMQQLLSGPLAVFKAVRSAIGTEAFPTPQELAVAESALDAAQSEFERLVVELGVALHEYTTASKIVPRSSAFPALKTIAPIDSTAK